MAQHLTSAQIVSLTGDATLTLSSTQSITGVSKEDPAVVTISGHGYVVDDWVYIVGVGGATNANGLFRISAKDTNTFTLEDCDCSEQDYTTGGTAQLVTIRNTLKIETAKTITAATNATPAVVTVANHGYHTGDYVLVKGVTGLTNINGVHPVTRVSSSTFTLGVNGNGTFGGSAPTVRRVRVSTVGDLRPHDLYDLIDALHRVGNYTRGSDKNADTQEETLSAIFGTLTV